MWEVAKTQYGLVTTAQALEELTWAQVRRRLERGELVRHRVGVYAIAGVPPSYEQSVMGAVLAAGEDAWASHLTAGTLRGLRVPPPTATDLLTLPNRRIRLDGVTHHRNKLIVVADVGFVRGIPITSAARTLVDCIPWLPGFRLGATVDDARRRGLLEMDDLEAALAAVDEGRRTGRRRVRPMRPVVADRHDAGGSDRELDVLRVLRRAGMPLPVQQHPIVVAGRQRYLDYAYPDVKVYLEFLGFSEHGLIRSTFDDDTEREAELALLGWLGLGFTSNTRPEDLVSRVHRALSASAA